MLMNESAKIMQLFSRHNSCNLQATAVAIIIKAFNALNIIATFFQYMYLEYVQKIYSCANIILYTFKNFVRKKEQ